MPEWKALNVRKICGSGSKPKICESTLPWKPKLNLLLRTRHGKTTMAFDSYDRTAVCIDIFTGCMPPKTA